LPETEMAISLPVKAEEIIEYFNMKPLPNEGGFFVETYKADGVVPGEVLPEIFGSDRAYGTAILYLLTPDSFSALHKLTSDEIFHFYAGDPVTMLKLFPEGSSETVTLGNDFLNGQKVQETVKRGVWQGAFLNNGGKWALLGTTVLPGFEYSDYTHGLRGELVEQYPDRKELIERLCAK
jgi:uncharacterized protein